jgi:hypothetical protein
MDSTAAPRFFVAVNSGAAMATPPPTGSAARVWFDTQHQRHQHRARIGRPLGQAFSPRHGRLEVES